MFAEGRYNLSDLLDEQDQKPRSNAGARRCMPRRATPTRSFNLALLIQRNNRHEDAEEYGLSFPKIISGRSDDAIRLGLVWRRWSRIGSCHRLHLRHRLPHTNVSRRVRPARTRRPACCSRHLVTCRRPRRCEAYDDRPLTKESPTWRRSCESSRAAPCRAWVAGARQVPGLPRRAWRPPQP